MTDTTFMAYQLGLIDRLGSNFTEAESVCVGRGREGVVHQYTS